MSNDRLYLAANDATVSMTRLFPSGMYLIELRDPSGDLVEKVRLDDLEDAEFEFNILSEKAETL